VFSLTGRVALEFKTTKRVSNVTLELLGILNLIGVTLRTPSVRITGTVLYCYVSLNFSNALCGVYILALSAK